MGNLSKNFSRYEFSCECGCEFETVDAELLRVLQSMMNNYSAVYSKARCTITSGCRCLEHNEQVQDDAIPGYVPYSSNSKHMYGIAADFVVEYKLNGQWLVLDPSVVYEYLDSEYPDKYGIGKYSSWNHLDVREDKGRWGIE